MHDLLRSLVSLRQPSYPFSDFLAQRGHFKDSSFINYLRYLQYWKEPKYVRFVKFPVCLHFLELLQFPEFRKEIVNGQVSSQPFVTRFDVSLVSFQCAKFLDDQTILHWQHYTRKRVKLVESAAATAASTAAAAQTATATTTAASAPVSATAAAPGNSGTQTNGAKA